jgi:hypothetical protein
MLDKRRDAKIPEQLGANGDTLLIKAKCGGQLGHE